MRIKHLRNKASYTVNISYPFHQGHYMCLAKFMDLGPVADVYIEIAGADIYFELTLDREECRFKVDTMEVKDMG